jgi:hypothetical protein
MQAPSRPRHQYRCLMHASPHTSPNTATVHDPLAPNPIASSSTHRTRRTQHTLQHHTDTHCRHSDAAACCTSPTPMQAPSRRRHQCRCLMHVSPHTSRDTATVHDPHAQSHRIIMHTPHTPHTTHTAASPPHSPLTSRCRSVLFLSNADASAVTPMPLSDARVATHITIPSVPAMHHEHDT